MINIVLIYYISGKIFQEIKYTDLNDLSKKLNSLINYYNCDSYIQLILNQVILNNFNEIINTSLLSYLNKDTFINIIFIQKKNLYCIGNKNGYAILEYKNDNYYKLLSSTLFYYGNTSYDIINTSSYRNLILNGIKKFNFPLQYVSNILKNDKEIVTEAIKQDRTNLDKISNNLKNDKEFILNGIKKFNFPLQYVSNILKNDKEIVTEAIKQDIKNLKYASNNLKNDRKFILKLIRENELILEFTKCDYNY